MGFRFRKSVGFGPFRINFSKSGVGYSVGGKGVRFTKKAKGGFRSTVSAPGTGLSYSKDFGGGKSGKKSSTKSSSQKQAPALADSGQQKSPKKQFSFGEALIALVLIFLLVGASSCSNDSDKPTAQAEQPVTTVEQPEDQPKAEPEQEPEQPAEKAAATPEPEKPKEEPKEQSKTESTDNAVVAAVPTVQQPEEQPKVEQPKEQPAAQPEAKPEEQPAAQPEAKPEEQPKAEQTAPAAAEAPKEQPKAEQPATTPKAEQSTPAAAAPAENKEAAYVLNTDSKKFHYPSCSSAKKISPENRGSCNSREEAIAMGYDPCGRCKP